MKKEILIGFIVGIIASIFGFIFAIQIFGQSDDWGDVIEKSISGGFFTKLISLGALLNIGTFFLFLKKNKDYRAKGVLISIVILFIATLIIKFLN
ncbi:hypothetical protein [Winogradskyella sediminis]|uniref:Uncharacterized protein n=1 Tax=Winogradskyella sediminis TaxID=1382466 RepID=A0A1H1Q023_9FLAO|nr:hypothetical protein [Winogradskyella sediminis]REG89919.1 hypothetical protein C8N41_1011166 [Winogradskyella sediminis]SDS16818.1 hypothetical protein SAMN04489797_1018 [Winogradskyella sediminis]